MSQLTPLPDEMTVRRAIAERQRELRTLRAVERAIARHRRQTEAMLERSTHDVPTCPADDRQEVR